MGNEKESRRSATSPSEQETTISFSRDSEVVDIWTSDTTMMTKLDKLCKTSQYYECVGKNNTIDGLLGDARYRITKKSCISFRTGEGRTYTEQEKELLRQRAVDLGLGKTTR